MSFSSPERSGELHLTNEAYAERFLGAIVGRPRFRDQVLHWIGFCMKK